MKNFSAATVRTLTVLLVVAAMLLSVTIIPELFSSNAENHAAEVSESSPERGLPNFDVRVDRTSTDVTLDDLRSSAGRDLMTVDLVRSKIAAGDAELRERMPDVVIEYNDRLGAAEVISPNVWKDDAQLLSPPSSGDRPHALKNFIRQNESLVGLNNSQIDSLKVTADYTNPDGNLSYTHLEQLIGDVPVFAGEVKAGFDRHGRIIRVINNAAPGLNYDALSKDFGDPADAVRAAAKYMNFEPREEDTLVNRSASTDLKTVFGGRNPQSQIRNPQSNDWATTAEKMYFPTEPGIAVPAWRVLIWQPVDTYYVIVDTAGRMLWRKNITEDQTQPATFNVYRNSNSYLDVADSPAPFTPGPNSPNGQQAPVISRSDITLIGNEGANSFNDLGWVTDGTNITDGNSNQAGVDRDFIDGVDAAQAGSPNRVFSAPTWNPPPGNPSPGDDPSATQAQRGAVVQMFYVMNRYHDELYKRGFTEAARNFQGNNFGRGGLGNDRVSSEGQDSSGTNNANFSTPADGGRGKMQMYIWTGPTPDYDGTADADIIIHEVTHGTSNRLHGNSTGLSTNMSRGMGEGWGDWYGHTMLAEPTDPINGIYTTGGYATYLGSSGFTSNYYYGIRRFPKAVIAFTGANGKPHNPLTFRHLNSNCNLTINTDGAFPRGPFGVSQCDAVHNAGEIWSSALWEVRALMIARLGFTLGTERVLQVVTDGMKLAPTGPTFLQERDAIISAALTFSTADADDVREGFRRRGMGFNATIQSTSPAAVTENYDPWPGGTPTPTPTPTVTPTPTPTPTPTATVSGVITRDVNNKGIGGVTVTLFRQPSGPTVTTSTNGQGNYSFSGVVTGFTYTITPSNNRYTFTPTSRSILVSGSVSGQNFVGSR
jgi:hypothetical protein